MLKRLGPAMVIGFALPVVLTAGASAQKTDPDAAVKKIFENLMEAVKANDKDKFVADGTEDVKKGTTAEAMDALSKHLGGRLKKGYQATYLCNLKQVGHQVHLWKLTFKDDGDDIVVRVALKEGRVAGFFLQ